MVAGSVFRAQTRVAFGADEILVWSGPADGVFGVFVLDQQVWADREEAREHIGFFPRAAGGVLGGAVVAGLATDAKRDGAFSGRIMFGDHFQGVGDFRVGQGLKIDVGIDQLGVDFLEVVGEIEIDFARRVFGEAIHAG